MDTFPKITGVIEKELLFHKKNRDIYCIGCRTNDKYLYAPYNEANLIYYVLNLVNGENTLDEIQKKINSEFSDKVRIDVESIIQKCKSIGLVECDKNEKIKHTTDEFELMLVNLKDFSLVKVYPFFEVVSKNIKKFSSIMLVIIFFASAIMMLFSDEINFPWKSVFSDTKVILYMWGIQFISLVLHEFSHAAVGYKYGARPKTFSIAVFYYCTLIFFIRLPGIYFQDTTKRIKIWGAGIFMNMFLASCFFLSFFIAEGELKVFLAIGVISNVFLVINNLMPFFYSDGYYMLSTLLKTPNLRKRSIFQIRKLIKNGIDKESLIYWVYLLVTILVTSLFIGGQLWAIGHSIFIEIKIGNSCMSILKNYSNLLILMSVGIIGKIIGKIKKIKAESSLS